MILKRKLRLIIMTINILLLKNLIRNLTSEIFAARLAKPNATTKIDIANSVKHVLMIN